MKLEISQETLDKTTRCQKGFSCLSGKRKGMCEVENYNNHEHLLITCLSDEECSYRTLFTDCYLCACPTRRELHERYHI